VTLPVDRLVLETAELSSVRASSTATAMDGWREDITELVREATEAVEEEEEEEEEEEDEGKSFSLVALVSLFSENDLVREAGGGGMN